jgi:DNA polymerase-3 subunit delta'
MSAGDARALAGWPVPAAIDALLKLCHDAMRLAGGAEPVFFAAAAWPKKAWAIQSLKPLAAWQRELLRVARHAEHPWNEGLLIDALVTLAQAALAGDGRGPALPASAFDTLAV